MEQILNMQGGGTLTLHREGNQIHMEARRPEDGQGLYKVWLANRRGGRLLLGTLAPEGDGLSLRRTLSISELERAGCWPLEEAQAPLAFPFAGPGRWYCEPRPWTLVSDPVLKGQLRRPMLCSRGEDGFSLAAPLDPAAPVPLNALFCLARPERVEGRPHLVWTFSPEGRPRLPAVGEEPPPARERKNSCIFPDEST